MDYLLGLFYQVLVLCNLVLSTARLGLGRCTLNTVKCLYVLLKSHIYSLMHTQIQYRISKNALDFGRFKKSLKIVQILG